MNAGPRAKGPRAEDVGATPCGRPASATMP